MEGLGGHNAANARLIAGKLGNLRQRIKGVIGGPKGGSTATDGRERDVGVERQSRQMLGAVISKHQQAEANVGIGHPSPFPTHADKSNPKLHWEAPISGAESTGQDLVAVLVCWGWSQGWMGAR